MDEKKAQVCVVDFFTCFYFFDFLLFYSQCVNAGQDLAHRCLCRVYVRLNVVCV